MGHCWSRTIRRTRSIGSITGPEAVRGRADQVGLALLPARSVQATIPASRGRHSGLLRRHGRHRGGARNRGQVGGRNMARPVRRTGVKKVPLSEVKDDLSRYLREAEEREVVITRHGKPAGVLIGFASEDDWFDYRLENDPRFVARIEKARASLRAGKGVRLEDLK